MPSIESLMNSLLAGLHEATAGQTFTSLTEKAKTTWNAQTPSTQGAIAGGLLGFLLSGHARGAAVAVAEVGGAALIGSLAAQAYADWQAQKAQTAPATPHPDLSYRLLQAMVAATKADGVVTAQERAALDTQLANLGLGPDAAAMMCAELQAPLDVDVIAALAHSQAEAAAIYTASLLVVDQKGKAEKAYLASLAARLGLDAALVRHLAANVPTQA